MDYVLPVIENHRAHSVRYCELCGAEVDRKGLCLQDCDNDPDVVALVGTLARWALYKPLHMRVLASRIECPMDSLRDTASKVGLGKSRVGDIIKELQEAIPGTDRLLGGMKPGAIAQKNRYRGANNTHRSA